MRTEVRLLAVTALLLGVCATVACDAIEVLMKPTSSSLDDEDLFGTRPSTKPATPVPELRAFQPRQWLRQAGITAGRGDAIDVLQLVPAGGSHLGFAGGSGGFLRTTDGGLAWQRLDVPELEGQALVGLAIVDARLAYVATATNLLVTQDGGDTWAALPEFAPDPTGGGPTANPDRARPIGAIRFPSPTRGYVLRGQSCWITRDGAKTWTVEPIGAHNGANVATLAAVGEDEAWAGGPGIYHRSTDGWQKQPPALAFGTDDGNLIFHDALRGWALGAPISGTPIQRTVDGGATWTPVTLRDVSGEPLKVTPKGAARLAFAPDATTGWLASGNQLYETRDAGNTWSLDKSTARVGLDDIVALVRLDVRTGWAASRSGGIYRYVDLGP